MPKLLVLILATVLLLAGCSEPSGPREWRFAIEEIPGSVQDAYAQKFKSLIEQNSDGKIKVTVYPYGALGTSAQMTEQVQNGALQFAFASPGHLGSVIPEVQLLTLHFVFSDDDAVNRKLLDDSKALHGPLAQAYRDKGLQVLSYIPEGWMVWTSNRPLHTPEDFQGFKIRTMVSPLLLDTYKAYGANPTPMAYSEVYGGLQLHMIDGEVNPVFAIEEMSFYEVQNYMTFAKQLPFVTSLITNPQFFASLPKKQQKLVRQTVAELQDYIYAKQERYNSERLKRIRAQSDIKIEHLSAAQRERFRKLSLPVRDTYVQLAGTRGKQILTQFLAERKALESAQPQAAQAQR